MLDKCVYRFRLLHGNLHGRFEVIKMEIAKKARKYRNRIEKNGLKTTRFSIISNTCIGGVICHDMGIKFQSPTVNIYIRPQDFVKFCENIHYYLQLPLVEQPFDRHIGYPVAKLGDVILYCKHYASFEEAKLSWDKRKKRIDWNHLYIIMTDRDFTPPISITKSIEACSEEEIKRFDALPYPNKICIVKNKKLLQKYQSCRQLLKGCDTNCVGIITDIIGITGKRMYQYVKNFDYIKFINDGL